MAPNTRTLTAAQWGLMHALELGQLDLATLYENLEVLEKFGLIEFSRKAWRPTEEGGLLVALRRQI